MMSDTEKLDLMGLKQPAAGLLSSSGAVASAQLGGYSLGHNASDLGRSITSKIQRSIMDSLDPKVVPIPPPPEPQIIDTAEGIKMVVNQDFIRHYGVNYGEEVRRRMTDAIMARVTDSIKIKSAYNDVDNVMVVDAVIKF